MLLVFFLALLVTLLLVYTFCFNCWCISYHHRYSSFPPLPLPSSLSFLLTLPASLSPLNPLVSQHPKNSTGKVWTDSIPNLRILFFLLFPLCQLLLLFLLDLLEKKKYPTNTNPALAHTSTASFPSSSPPYNNLTFTLPSLFFSPLLFPPFIIFITFHFKDSHSIVSCLLPSVPCFLFPFSFLTFLSLSSVLSIFLFYSILSSILCHFLYIFFLSLSFFDVLANSTFLTILFPSFSLIHSLFLSFICLLFPFSFNLRVFSLYLVFLAKHSFSHTP